MSRDGQYLILGGDNGVVEVWRTHDLSVVYTYPACDSSVRSLALSFDQRSVDGLFSPLDYCTHSTTQISKGNGALWLALVLIECWLVMDNLASLRLR